MLTALAATLLGTLAWAGDQHQHGHDDGATVSHRFEDAEAWSVIFDDPARDAWQKPADLVAALHVERGWTVADVGAGTGYFNPHLSRAVGAEGHVIAVDIEPNLVEHMTKRAVAEGTANVEARLGAADDPKLTKGEVDLVLLVDTYHHIDDRIAYFTRLRDAVRSGGLLVVVDFKPGDLPVGPSAGHKLPPDKIVAELIQAGWVQDRALDVLPYQYVLVFRDDA